MRRLDYSRYGAQGGDWGSQVTTRIGALDPEHCAAIHLNMAFAQAPKESIPLTDEEKADLAAMASFTREEAGYAQEQMTKPQTLGMALNDSPAGLLGWIVEKFRTWSDCDGDIERVYTKDQLLTNIMFYWAPNSIASAANMYYESRRDPAGFNWPRIEVPCGVSVFPKEIYRSPRNWVEPRMNVTQWVEHEKGGHFAAMEQPEALLQDVRAFFRTVR